MKERERGKKERGDKAWSTPARQIKGLDAKMHSLRQSRGPSASILFLVVVVVASSSRSALSISIHLFRTLQNRLFSPTKDEEEREEGERPLPLLLRRGEFLIASRNVIVSIAWAARIEQRVAEVVILSRQVWCEGVNKAGGGGVGMSLSEKMSQYK